MTQQEALGRVLVTGGAGTIGSNLVDLLVREGASEIRVLDDFTRGRRENLAWAMQNGAAYNSSVRVIEGDIRDAKLVHESTQGADLVFHLAAIRITQCAQEPRLANEVLVDGTFNVLEAAAAYGVRKVIASSSASVYGLAESFPTAENHHPYNNDTFYGAAKAFNEGMLRSFHAMYGLDYVALRYFNVYGPRMDAHGMYTEVLIRWMERIEAGQPPLIFGDGEQTMDFVDVRDIARANLLAARSAADRRGLQRGPRRGDQPQGTGRGAAARHGRGRPRRRARPRARGQRRDPAAGRHLGGRAEARLPGRDRFGSGPA